MYRLQAILALTLVYLALTTNVEILNILTGVVIALIVIGLVPRDRQREWRMDWRDWPTAVWAFVRYVVLLTLDLFVSGLQVARIVLSPKMPIKPGIIAIPSNTQTDLGTALSAHAITLTPGEMVVEIDDEGVMYTHVLDATQAEEAVINAQNRRRQLLEKIFP